MATDVLYEGDGFIRHRPLKAPPKAANAAKSGDAKPAETPEVEKERTPTEFEIERQARELRRKFLKEWFRRPFSW